jgi:hypothetical protein
MDDLDSIAYLLSRRCFAEAAYFGAMHALKQPSAQAHLFAGLGCGGCAEPLAVAQRSLEDAPVPREIGAGGLTVSPATNLIYEGFFHLIEALRLDPSIKVSAELREVADYVADDLAYVSRRELHTAPDKRRRYSLRLASVAAAVLIRRLTESDRELPGVLSATLEVAAEAIEAELGRRGGDAAFFTVDSSIAPR